MLPLFPGVPAPTLLIPICQVRAIAAMVMVFPTGHGTRASLDEPAFRNDAGRSAEQSVPRMSTHLGRSGRVIRRPTIY